MGSGSGSCTSTLSKRPGRVSQLSLVTTVKWQSRGLANTPLTRLRRSAISLDKLAIASLLVRRVAAACTATVASGRVQCLIKLMTGALLLSSLRSRHQLHYLLYLAYRIYVFVWGWRAAEYQSGAAAVMNLLIHPNLATHDINRGC